MVGILQGEFSWEWIQQGREIPIGGNVLRELSKEEHPPGENSHKEKIFWEKNFHEGGNISRRTCTGVIISIPLLPNLRVETFRLKFRYRSVKVWLETYKLIKHQQSCTSFKKNQVLGQNWWNQCSATFFNEFKLVSFKSQIKFKVSFSISVKKKTICQPNLKNGLKVKNWIQKENQIHILLGNIVRCLIFCIFS